MKFTKILFTALISCASFVGSAQQANFAGVTGNGSASTCALNKANGIVVIAENGADLKCFGFTMSTTIKKKAVEVTCTSGELCDDAKTMMKSLKLGGTLHIDNIKSENIYGVAVNLPAVTITVTDCGPNGK